jgi:hypothetical protein
LAHLRKERRRNMKSKPKIAVLTSIAILAFMALVFAYEIKNKSQFPQKGWTAGFHAYHGIGYDSAPLMVFSVRSQIDKGLVAVQVKNRSEKSIASIQLGWYVSGAEGAGEILAKGETRVLAASVPGQERAEVAIPNVSWERVLKPLMRNGTLLGDYDIWIVVSKITYDDGSVWTFSQPANVARVAGKKNAHFVPEAGCANQTCKNHEGVYRCVDGAGELCTNHGNECTSSICEKQLSAAEGGAQ